MIRLEVQPYCSDCFDFNPEVSGPEKIIFSDGRIDVGDTIVRCKYAKRCEAIKRYLSKCTEDDAE